MADKQPDQTHWARWKANPIEFVETALANPKSGLAFSLLPAEKAFLERCFDLGDDGRLKYPEQVYGCPKKSGKTAFAAMLTLVTVLLHAGRYPEALIIANDFEQAQGRVFEACRKIVECSPWLRRQAKVTQDKITFPSIGATIKAIPSDYASAAGSNQNISCFDELWAYTSERSRRLWDEMVPPPTRKIAMRLTVTYAGFEAESVLLEELYKRGLQQPQIGKDLYAGDGVLMFWSHEPVAPWQTEAWLAEMRRSLRPNQYLRMIENRFVSAESSFVDMAQWDACVVPELTPSAERVPVWVGVDASTKRDSSALVALTYDKKSSCVRLVQHRVFVPGPGDPIDFDQIEATLLAWRQRYAMRRVWADPFQMASVMQRLAKQHVPIEEYVQSVPGLTATTSNLFDLIQNRQLVLYPDAGMRLAASRAIIVESSRGWRLDKLKQAHKIDVIVALSMAALCCVKGQEQPGYDLFDPGLLDDDDVAAEAPAPSLPFGWTLEEYERRSRPVSPMPAEYMPPGVTDAFVRARLDALRKAHMPDGGLPFEMDGNVDVLRTRDA